MPPEPVQDTPCPPLDVATAGCDPDEDLPAAALRCSVLRAGAAGAGLTGAGFLGLLVAAGCRAQYWLPAARTDEGSPAACTVRPGVTLRLVMPWPAAAAAAWPAAAGAGEPRLRRYGVTIRAPSTPTAATAGTAKPARLAALRLRGGAPCRPGCLNSLAVRAVRTDFKNLPSAGSAPSYAADFASHQAGHMLTGQHGRTLNAMRSNQGK
jgi:hypothetical protein